MRELVFQIVTYLFIANDEAEAWIKKLESAWFTRTDQLKTVSEEVWKELGIPQGLVAQIKLALDVSGEAVFIV